MKFFEAVPDELFSPLASPNRALYADALDVLYTAYREKLKLPEDMLYSMLRSRLEQQLAAVNADTNVIVEKKIIIRITDSTSGGGSFGGGGGGGGGGFSAPSYAVSVDDVKHGTVTVSPKSASKGDTVTITATPDKGYTLESLTVLDKDGKALELTDKGGGKYTFVMPAGKVTVKAVFMDDNTMLNFFTDVHAEDYYYDAVLWAAQKGITGGMSDTLFAPNAACTRAQIVTFLWRAAGSPEPKALSSFADVPADVYYAKAVAWAVENGITEGTSDTTFAPGTICTRAQGAALLYRAAGSPVVSGSAAFTDVPADAYYADAAAKAAEAVRAAVKLGYRLIDTAQVWAARRT